MQDTERRGTIYGLDIETSRLAYQLWRAAGRPTGRYLEYWTQAKRQHGQLESAATPFQDDPPAGGCR